MARPIFVSCRRTDEANFSAVQSRLSRSFGEDNVSIGQYSTEQADAFADELQEAVTGAKVVLAIIGPRWEAEFGERASSRPAFDPVLMALALAIKAGVRIIPILVKRPGASLKEELLPTEIRDLARLPAFRVEGFNLTSQDSPDIRRLMDEIGAQPGMSRARWGEKTIQYSGLDPNGRRNQDIEPREIEKIGQRIYDWLYGEVQAHATELSVAIWGIPGIGKSTLIHRLAHGDVAQAPVLRLYPDGILFGRLGKSAGSKEITRNLQEWATADKLDVALPEKINLENTAGIESEMQHWHELLGSVLRNRKMLLVIDDVWDSEVARKLRVGGNDCAYIYTTRQKRIADDLASCVIEMPKLDESESLNVIKNIAPNAFRSPISDACQSDITQIVHRIDGLPLALVLLGSLVNVESKSANPGRRLKAALKKFDRLNEIAFPIRTSLGETTLAAVIESSYAALKERGDDGEILRRAFRCLTALRPDPERFSLNLALQVVATPGASPIVANNGGIFEYSPERAAEDPVSGDTDEEKIKEIISDLADYGLISAARDTVPTASSVVETEDGEGELYSIHRAVAECIAAYLTPQDKKLIYSSAANYFQQRLGSLEEQFQQSTSSYRKSFRYENPDWQRAMNNWRFYVMAQGDYANAAFKFTKEWFGAFWWWGCFESFEFCEALIRDWPDEEKDAEKQDQVDLMNILACYPKETSERRAGKQSQWHTVRASLERVRDARELKTSDIAKLNGD
ncbi:MAG TPA: NB-ARC domain-containing protein, partial [Paraburkholderia sp.]